MMDSREKFEAWWKDQRFYGDPMLEKQAREAWLAGRESMRDEAVHVCEQQILPSYANDMNVISASQAADAIKEIQP